MHPPQPLLPLEQGLGGMQGAAAPQAQQTGSGRAQALAAPAVVLGLCCLWGRKPQHPGEEQILEEPANFGYGLWVSINRRGHDPWRGICYHQESHAMILQVGTER